MFLVDGRLGRNEDQSVLLDDQDCHLIAVADGMGGHAQGEVASERILALLNLARREDRLPADADGHDRIRSVLEGVHHALQREAAPDPTTQNMGATVVGCLFFPGGRLAHFHAGDSRLYLLRAGRLQRMTIDHTVREELQQAGGDPGQVGGHLVTSCIGGGMDHPRVDTAAAQDPVSGDRYLLCSDGLTDMVADERIAELLVGEDSAASAHELVGEAKRMGGTDNITVVVVEVS